MALFEITKPIDHATAQNITGCRLFSRQNLRWPPSYLQLFAQIFRADSHPRFLKRQTLVDHGSPYLDVLCAPDTIERGCAVPVGTVGFVGANHEETRPRAAKTHCFLIGGPSVGAGAVPFGLVVFLDFDLVDGGRDGFGNVVTCSVAAFGVLVAITAFSTVTSPSRGGRSILHHILRSAAQHHSHSLYHPVHHFLRPPSHFQFLTHILRSDSHPLFLKLHILLQKGRPDIPIVGVPHPFQRGLAISIGTIRRIRANHPSPCFQGTKVQGLLVGRPRVSLGIKPHRVIKFLDLLLIGRLGQRLIRLDAPVGVDLVIFLQSVLQGGRTIHDIARDHFHGRIGELGGIDATHDVSRDFLRIFAGESPQGAVVVVHVGIEPAVVVGVG
mmetsp:Transcript_5786/g.12604  ORF Transcript_5786/g.12604 Transcript_5786/m.12604 type:complete len:384 (-) Transcript_5786:1367-2518(-)